ncbi:MAG: hypothetical protein OEW05_02325 [Candidatus Aminicenantes bacterium]|nr:hypothetical protein [Candidatus Aminicenantes bacterium]
MSLYLLKTVIATAAVAVGLVSFLSMMALQGRPEKIGDPAKLRRIHKAAGYVFIILLAPLVYLGAGFVREMGDGLATRAVFHLVLAVGLITLLLLKVLIARFFRAFLKYAPGVGMTLFVMTLVIYLLTAGFVFIHKAGG